MEYSDGSQEIMQINRESIFYFLEGMNIKFNFLAPDNLIKFYREKADKKYTAKSWFTNNKCANRMLLTSVFETDIIILSYENALHKEIYEIADFLAYLYGCCLHENSKKFNRYLLIQERKKYGKMFEWCEKLPLQKTITSSLFYANGNNNMNIIDGV